jgi:hypothetical protein
MTKKRKIFLGIAVVVLSVMLGVILFLSRVNRGPNSEFLIALECYSCEKCKSLDGGIHGKGPRKRLQSSSGDWCVHDWSKINRAEFKQAGVERFGIDWSREVDFWARD